MPLNLTGRHVEITEPLREWIESKTERYAKYHDRISLIEVTLTKEKAYYLADIVVKAGRSEYNAKTKHPELRVAFDEANDKIIKQMDKKKGRIIGRKKGSPAMGSAILPEDAEAFVQPAGLPAWVQLETIEIQTCTVEEAFEKLKLLDEREFFVFRNVLNDSLSILYRRKDGAIRLIQP